MLVLSRKRGEVIKIGDFISVTVDSIQGQKVGLRVEAPCEVPIHRREVYDAVLQQLRLDNPENPPNGIGLREGTGAAGNLVLVRRRDEEIMIGDDIRLVVVSIRGDKVRLGIEAPKKVPVHRLEVYLDIQREEARNRQTGTDPAKESA